MRNEIAPRTSDTDSSSHKRRTGICRLILLCGTRRRRVV